MFNAPHMITLHPVRLSKLSWSCMNHLKRSVIHFTISPAIIPKFLKAFVCGWLPLVNHDIVTTLLCMYIYGSVTLSRMFVDLIPLFVLTFHFHFLLSVKWYYRINLFSLSYTNLHWSRYLLKWRNHHTISLMQIPLGQVKKTLQKKKVRSLYIMVGD